MEGWLVACGGPRAGGSAGFVGVRCGVGGW